MATVSSVIKLTSSDLSTNTLSLTASASQGPTGSSGLNRAKISGTTKAANITITAGATTRSAMDGKYLDITDNHGLKRRYVWTDASASGVATGTIIASNSDIGSTSTPDPGLIGGIAMQYGSGTTQNGLLVLLKAAIEHANGHNGSITVSAVPTQAASAQSITLTNSVAGESGNFLIERAAATWTLALGLNGATVSKDDHLQVIKANEYASATHLYIKNMATNVAHTITFYHVDTNGEDNLLTLSGGQSAFLPLNAGVGLNAITSNAGTVLEYMHYGVLA